jgi:hypothetical protein
LRHECSDRWLVRRSGSPWAAATFSGETLMDIWSPVFAYFGPEVQFPLVSFVGAAMGLVMMVGGAPIRRIKQWVSSMTRKNN